MKLGNIVVEISKEVKRAEEKCPEFPIDPIHAAAIIGEESGELIQAALQFTYENCDDGNIAKMKEEAIQTAAMCFRFLNIIEEMDNIRSRQIKTEVMKIQ